MGVILAILVVAAISGLIGMAIGKGKDRAAAGFWLGFFLSWVGWIIVAVMSPTAESEARHRVAVDAATQRLTGGGGARQVSAMLQRDNARVLAAIYDAARGDRDPSALHAAIDQFAGARQLTRPMTDWFFASNPATFVIRHDGRLFAATATSVRALDRTAAVAVSVDGNGQLLSVTVGGTTFADPRPDEPAKRLLAACNATRHVVAAPENELAVPAAGLSSAQETLRTLQQLHSDGLISDNEYESKRRDVIDRI